MKVRLNLKEVIKTRVITRYAFIIQSAARALASGEEMSGSKATLTVTSLSDYMIQ